MEEITLIEDKESNNSEVPVEYKKQKYIDGNHNMTT